MNENAIHGAVRGTVVAGVGTVAGVVGVLMNMLRLGLMATLTTKKETC